MVQGGKISYFPSPDCCRRRPSNAGASENEDHVPLPKDAERREAERQGPEAAPRRQPGGLGGQGGPAGGGRESGGQTGAQRTDTEKLQTQRYSSLHSVQCLRAGVPFYTLVFLFVSFVSVRQAQPLPALPSLLHVLSLTFFSSPYRF